MTTIVTNFWTPELLPHCLRSLGEDRRNTIYIVSPTPVQSKHTVFTSPPDESPPIAVMQVLAQIRRSPPVEHDRLNEPVILLDSAHVITRNYVDVLSALPMNTQCLVGVEHNCLGVASYRSGAQEVFIGATPLYYTSWNGRYLTTLGERSIAVPIHLFNLGPTLPTAHIPPQPITHIEPRLIDQVDGLAELVREHSTTRRITFGTKPALHISNIQYDIPIPAAAGSAAS